MGDKGKGAADASEAYAKQAGQVMKDLYQQTDPARRQLIQMGTSYLNNNFDPTSLPGYKSNRSALEDQYNVARQNTIDNHDNRCDHGYHCPSRKT